MKSEVVIEEMYDGFSVTVENSEGKETVHVDQEDSVEKLVKVFEHLGCSTRYEEVY